MYNYYKVEEQHVEEISKFLNEKEIPFTNVDNPLVYTCENIVNDLIENKEEELKPIFRKIEPEIVNHMVNKYNEHHMINLAHESLLIDCINNIIESQNEE